MENYVTIGEYGLGELVSPPDKDTVFLVDVDAKTITQLEAFVSYSDSYIFERIDVGEVDMVVDSLETVQFLLDDEGYTLKQEGE